MANQSTQHAHYFWMKTAIVTDSRKHVPRSVSIKRSAPIVKSTAEKEAEQWVAAMMFERYNS